MKKIIIVFSCVFSVVSQANDEPHTQTVKGQVLDHQSKSPVIGATIVLKGSDPAIGAITDEDGNFRLKDIPVGRHSFVLMSVGYEPKVLTNVSVGSGKQVVLEVEMIESLTEMEAVEVVAEKDGEGLPLNEMATVSAVSFSSAESGRYAASFDDPARAAVSQAGVTGGGNDLINEIVIRGNSPKGVLWRLEGVEIPNPNHFANIGSSAGGLSMLNGRLLSRSDFFTGAFPAQYGNATSGIFDLNIRKGNTDAHEHSFQAGILGIAGTSEGPFTSSGNASYLASYRYSTLSFFSEVEFGPMAEQEDLSFQDLLLKVHLPTRRFGSFSVWGLGGANYYSYKPDRSIGEESYRDIYQQMGVGGITHVAYFNENTFVESVASMSFQTFDRRRDSLRLQIRDQEVITEVSYRLSSYVNHKFNARHTLRVGGIYNRLSYDLLNKEWLPKQGYFQANLDDDGGTDFYQGFAQWQWRTTPQLTLNTGFHLSHFALNKDTYLEPRFGFRWDAFSSGAFIGGAGMHSRRETLSLYMADQHVNGNAYEHNKNLSFTKAAHAVLGYEHKIKPALLVKAEIYYQYLYDVPVWPDATVDVEFLRTFSAINQYDGYTTFKLTNEGTGRNYGLELTLKKSFSDSYYFMSTASLYQSKYRGIDNVERNTVFNGNHVFNLLCGKEFRLSKANNVLDMNVRFVHAGGKRHAPILLEASKEAGSTIYNFSRNYESKLKDYIRLDFGISFKDNNKNSASVYSINIQNVLGIENVQEVYYNSFLDSVVRKEQLGMFPNLSYRIEF